MILMVKFYLKSRSCKRYFNRWIKIKIYDTEFFEEVARDILTVESKLRFMTLSSLKIFSCFHDVWTI